MDAVVRIVKFAAGSVVGFVAGVAAAMLAAPRSGSETRQWIDDRVKAAQLAGAEAQAAAEAALIDRFRTEVADPTALREEEVRVREERAQAVEAIGLGLGAPGALAAHAAIATAPTSAAPATEPAAEGVPPAVV